MATTTLLLVALVPVILFTLWHAFSTITPPPIPSSLQNKRIILLIAHPDDESMFFAPALQALTHPSLGNHLKILCMSTGDAEGLGETRRKELESAAVTLGVRKREDVFVMDDPRFQDGMKNEWDPKEIARVLATAFAPQLVGSSSSNATESEKESTSKDRKSSSSSKSKLVKGKSRSSTPSTPSTPTTSTTSLLIQDGPRTTIDVLLTFDPHGISSHPNHISLHKGAHHFLSQLMAPHPGYACPVDLYTLTTINILRKYSFALDILPTYISGIFSSIYEGFSKSKKNVHATNKDKSGNQVVFVSDVVRYFKARKAMVSGHKSQMVWFRWGWIGMGRYMVINDLKREGVVRV